MKKIFIKKFTEIILITLLFLGCVSTPPQTTTPSSTTQSPFVPAEFEIVDLRVAPENPTMGDTLTILVDVQNTGDSPGSYRVVVSIGSKLKSKNIEVEGKGSKTVEFQETVDTEGDIKIVAGNLAKTITVSSLGTPTTIPPTTSPPEEEPFFYVLQGKFIQTTEHEREVYYDIGDMDYLYIETAFIPSVSSYHFSQQVFKQSTEYSETPDKTTKTGNYIFLPGYPKVTLEKAEWNDPPSEITIKTITKCKNIISYSPFITQSKYPLDTKAIPSDIKKYYLASTSICQSDDPEIIAKAEEIVEGAESAIDAIVRIVNWVRYNIRGACSREMKTSEGVPFHDAKNILKYRKGSCSHYARLCVALLRAAGIPAKHSGGDLTDVGGEQPCGHAWISVYLPEEGFVEFESTGGKPRSKVVPETILLPQHILRICAGSSNIIDDTGERTHELNRSTKEVTRLPEKKTYVSESINKGDIISFLANVEEKKWTGEYQISFDAVVPLGWKVFFSNETITIDTELTLSREILITIIPPSDAKSGDEAEIKIIADDGSQQGEITIHLSIE